MKKLGLALFFGFAAMTAACAADKSWNAGGDGTDWSDAANWLPSSAPAASDDALIDMTDAAVDISQSFNARSLTLAGKKASTVTVNNFIDGTFEPADASEAAVLNRKDGLLTLKGSAGKMTLKGAYKDSEETIAEEPSFMFHVQ